MIDLKIMNTISCVLCGFIVFTFTLNLIFGNYIMAIIDILVLWFNIWIMQNNNKNFGGKGDE